MRLSGTKTGSANQYNGLGDQLYDLGGARPTLDLNFASNGSLVDSVTGKTLVTHTRASNATYVDGDGIIQTAGTNVPRFDHNPTTGESLGLLVEESRTNIVSYSEEFDNSYWGKVNATIDANAFTALDGTLTADTLIPAASSGEQRVRRDVTGVSSNTTYTLSVYAKAAGYNFVAINHGNYLVADYLTYFNLNTGTVATNAAGNTASITDVGNGWYRCSVMRTTSSSQTVISSRFYVAETDGVKSFTGDGTSGIYLWGAQLEAGAFPTSYIRTSGSTVTRSADVTSITGTNFSSWYNQTEGVLFANSQTPAPTSSFDVVATIGSSSVSIIVSLARNGADSRGFGANATGSTGSGTNSYPVNTFVKQALAAKQNDFALSTNGSSINADTSTDPLTAAEHMYIGSNAGDSNSLLTSHIKRLTYWPTRLSNDTLQTITR